MSPLRLFRAEIRKLTTTRMPLAFLAVLAGVGAINASLVRWGTDFDGSKAFISTGADQQSLMAFGQNALLICGLFGAVAGAREHTYGTAIWTFLASPRRARAVAAQLAAVATGGAVLGTAGALLTAIGVSGAAVTTEFGFLVSAGGVLRVVVAAAFCGAIGAVLGAGLGVVVRNAGGAVTGVVLALMVVPPLLVQLSADAAPWVPSALATTLSGITPEAAGAERQAGVGAALAVLVLWAVVPSVAAFVATDRRDVV